MKKDASALLVLVIIAALSFLAPSAPVEPVKPPPPPIVETVQATAKASGHTVSAEAVGGLAIMGGAACLGVRLSRMGARRRRRNVITTDKPALIALMRRLETMSLILENATTDE